MVMCVLNGNSVGLFFLHQPHSAAIGPSDFHLFGALKGTFRGRRFGGDDEVVGEVKK
jgi:hypothetical protein